jgi:hypothetical protein
MSAIDGFFKNDQEQTHPLLRSIKKGIANGITYQVDIHRENRMPGSGSVKIYVQIASQPGTVLSVYAWSSEINSGLIQLKVRAVDESIESFRFALTLRDSMKEIETRHGNGYFNSVLVELLKESKLDQNEPIGDILKDTTVYPPNRGNGYEFCRDSIALAISGRARELTKSLGYTEVEAKAILSRAIAMFIDDRFSVTSRRQLGGGVILRTTADFGDLPLND